MKRSTIRDIHPAPPRIPLRFIQATCWLFADTPKGAHASGIFYSLIETAKANEIEPYAYLRHVFKALPYADSVEKIEALLPWNVENQIPSLKRNEKNQHIA